MNILAVLIGGGIGSLSRYLISIFAAQNISGRFPIGTLIVNLAGCYFIGLLFELFENIILSPNLRLFIFTGFFGGFTTFSSFSLESQFVAAKAQLQVIGPLAVLVIFLILFALYGNFKFPFTIALGVVMTEPVGALLALKLTGTPFSVSSVLGLLALMGVSVETAVILVSYINKLRLEGKSIRAATHEASLLRLRPIMMTALVACLGLLPAAMSHGIGSDTQRPFAIVIVAGLMSRLLLGFFVNPVLYELVARPDDVLQV